jgi:hypothetical protein
MDKVDVSTNDEFDVNKFNKLYDKLSDEQLKEKKKKELEELEKQYGKKDITKNLYELSVGEIVIGFKDAMFGIINDLLHFNINFNTFSKEHRLFYLGILLLLISVTIYIISSHTDLDLDNKSVDMKFDKLKNVSNKLTK